MKQQGEASLVCKAMHIETKKDQHPQSILSGCYLQDKLQMRPKDKALLGHAAIEMLESALRFARRRNTASTSGQNYFYTFTNALRLTFSALDYIGCKVNKDNATDFERVDEFIIHSLASCDQLVVEVRWLKEFHFAAWDETDQQEVHVRLIGLWNFLKNSAPSTLQRRAHDGAPYYVIGAVWVKEKELIDYIKRAKYFVQAYFRAINVVV